MIKAVQIPHDVFVAAKRVLDGEGNVDEAIAAALNAWEGVVFARQGTVFTNTWQKPQKGEQVNIVVLPLTRGVKQ